MKDSITILIMVTVSIQGSSPPGGYQAVLVSREAWNKGADS